MAGREGEGERGRLASRLTPIFTLKFKGSPPSFLLISPHGDSEPYRGRESESERGKTQSPERAMVAEQEEEEEGRRLKLPSFSAPPAKER